jgi:hypothetical protein
MKEESNNQNMNPDFKAQYLTLSDNEILDILKKRAHYQKAASDAAIQEAIKRGLIHSEQDLFSEQFRVEPLRTSIFPTIENEEKRVKTRKSLVRSLLIAGAIPVVWGALQIYRSNALEGVSLILLGLLWAGIILHSVKNAGSKLVYLLYLLWAAATIYLSKEIYSLSFVSVTDIFITAACCLLVLYGLLFFRKLS